MTAVAPYLETIQGTLEFYSTRAHERAPLNNFVSSGRFAQKDHVIVGVTFWSNRITSARIV